MKRFLLVVLVLSQLILLAQQKPNVLVIITDDAGFNDFGFQQELGAEMGWSDMKPVDIYDASNSFSLTPNLDVLAASGTVFSRGYVTNSVCATSRAGLLTGRYQNRFGYEYNLVTWQMAPDGNGGFLSHDEAGVDDSEVTIAEHLKSAGYATSCIGKWHLGEEMVHHPNNQGFDDFYGLISGSRHYWKGEVEMIKKLQENSVIVEDNLSDNDYLTDIFTQKSIAYIGASNDLGKPFFQYLSYTTPHGPYEVKEADYNALSGCDGCDGTAWSQFEDSTNHRQEYLAMQKSLDDNIVTLMNYLESTPQKDTNGQIIQGSSLRDNTIIFFINDNGGPGDKPPKNAPLIGSKSQEHEGGLRVPFFVSWPGTIPQGYYNHQVISTDILATAVAAAEMDSETFANPIDGVNLVPHIQNNTVAHDYLYWRKMDVWSVVANNDGYKVVVSHEDPVDQTDDIYEMYDLNYSPRESVKNNKFKIHPEETEIFASENTAIALDLINKLNAWNSTLPYPDYIGKTIYENAYGCTSVVTCQPLLDRYNGTGNIPEPLELEFNAAGNCFFVDSNNVIYGGTASDDIVICDRATNGKLLKALSGPNNYIEFQNINVDPNYESYNIKVYYFASTTANKTIDVKINGDLFADDFVLGSGNGGCYENKDSVVKTIENIPFNKTSTNTIRLYNSPAIDKICIEYIQPLSLTNDSINKMIVYPTIVDQSLNEYLYITNKGILSGSFAITINDITGRVIYKEDFDNNDTLKINSKHLREGINFVTLRNNNKSITRKVIMY